MAVVIRMQRAGARNRPFWHVVVADSRMKRDGRFLDKVGYYDPLPDPAVIQIDAEKVKAWVAKGAKTSQKVEGLIRKASQAEAEGAVPSSHPPVETPGAQAGEQETAAAYTEAPESENEREPAGDSSSQPPAGA